MIPSPRNIPRIQTPYTLSPFASVSVNVKCSWRLFSALSSRIFSKSVENVIDKQIEIVDARDTWKTELWNVPELPRQFGDVLGEMPHNPSGFERLKNEINSAFIMTTSPNLTESELGRVGSIQKKPSKSFAILLSGLI